MSKIELLKKNKSSPLRLWILNPKFCSFLKGKHGLCIEIGLDRNMLYKLKKLLK